MKDLHRRDFSSLRYITNTAAALPVPHVRRLRELFPRAKIFSMFLGLTECKRVSFLSPDQIDSRPDSVGKAIPNEEVYIVDEGSNEVTYYNGWGFVDRKRDIDDGRTPTICCEKCGIGFSTGYYGRGISDDYAEKRTKTLWNTRAR